MSPDCTCVGERDSLLMRRGVSLSSPWVALPICGDDKPLEGNDQRPRHRREGPGGRQEPGSTSVAEVSQGDGKTVTIGVDDSIEEALRAMAEHQARRLPVIDGRELVGIVAQADVARNYDESKVADLVEAISR